MNGIFHFATLLTRNEENAFGNTNVTDGLVFGFGLRGDAYSSVGGVRKQAPFVGMDSGNQSLARESIGVDDVERA